MGQQNSEACIRLIMKLRTVFWIIHGGWYLFILHYLGAFLYTLICSRKKKAEKIQDRKYLGSIAFYCLNPFDKEIQVRSCSQNTQSILNHVIARQDGTVQIPEGNILKATNNDNAHASQSETKIWDNPDFWMNIRWGMLIGWHISIVRFFLGISSFATVIGIPFAIEHFKSIGLAIAPFGNYFILDKTL